MSPSPDAATRDRSHVLLDARYRGVLGRRWPGRVVVDLHPLPGGRSGHTWAATLDGPPHRVVLRAGTPGRPPVGRHDVGRQARVLRALAGAPGVAVPAVLVEEEGDPVVVVVEHLEGDSCEPVMDGVGRLMPDVIERRAVAAAAMLAALHAAPVEPLADEPPMSVADELDRWTAVLRACEPEVVRGGEDLVAGLAAAVPAEMAPVITHGDYRLGNILAAGTVLTGIIDWEIWGLTDPRIDLAWMLLFCDPDDWPGVHTDSTGMPSAATLQGVYEAQAGPLADMTWFLAFARLKMAAITAHNLRRHREGRRHDPEQERFPRMIARMIERGLEVLR